MKRFKIPIIITLVCLVFWAVLPNYLLLESDSGDYFAVAANLKDTTWRTFFYPLIIRLLNYNYELITLFNAFVAAGSFIFFWLITKRDRDVLIFVSFFGIYFLYIPYVMTDLLFGFFMIGAYYFLTNKKLLWHFVFIALASVTRPSLAWWFVIEPILVWLIYKDKKIAVWSFLICFVICQINPLKNLIDNGRYIHSIGLGINLNDFITSDSKLRYLFVSLKSHLFPSHWNVFFETIGYYKRDIETHNIKLQGSEFVLIIDWLFFFLYSILYLRFIKRVIWDDDWFNLIWVSYFVGQSLIVHTMGSRMRLPFEFILFL